MRGFLDKEQLKEMNREDLQKLAKDLGVSAGGKTEDIIARIAAVEIEVPEEGDGDPDHEASQEDGLESAAGQKDGLEGAAGQPGEPSESQEAQEEGETDKLTINIEKARDQANKAAGMVTVKVIERYLDRNQNKIKEVGETFSVEKERAALLLAKHVAEIIE